MRAAWPSPASGRGEMRAAWPSPASGRRASGGGGGHAGGGEVDAALAAADLHEDLRLVHLAEGHARGGPRLEVLGDGDLPAGARRVADAVVLHPARRARALRTAGAGGVA